jgi:methylenetetrahydrofolate dehydrogenase (NADP+)/methenyltetrahydrofolate cyclohydrolase
VNPEPLSVAELTEAVLEQAAAEVAEAGAEGRELLACTLSIGDSPTAKLQETSRERLCREAGIGFRSVTLSSEASQIDADGAMSDLSRDPTVTAISLLGDLPSQFNRTRLLRRMPPEKDAEGVHPQCLGRLIADPDSGASPPLCAAVLAALTTHDIDLYDKHVLIQGEMRSFVLPLATLLSLKHCRLSMLPHLLNATADEVAAVDVAIISGDSRPWLKQGMKPDALLIELGACPPSAGSLLPTMGDTKGPGFVVPAGEIDRLEGGMYVHNVLECHRLALAGGLKGPLTHPTPSSQNNTCNTLPNERRK